MSIKIIACSIFLLSNTTTWAASEPRPLDQSKRISVDVCIYGGTAAGVIAAYAAEKCGKTVILVEPGKMLGGMTTGGLGQTDIGNKQAISGLSRQFYKNVGEKYGVEEQWTFEPHVAMEVLQSYIKSGKINILYQQQIFKLNKSRKTIQSILVKDPSQPKSVSTEITAKQFIDCTYEGDLLGKSGVSFTVGREDNKQYGETVDGYLLAEYHKQSGGHQFPDGVSPYKIPGDPSSGLLWGISNDKPVPQGTGDKRIQAYNFRMCLTDSAENRIPITRPRDYDPAKYELLVRLFEAQPNMRKINDYFIWSHMPNRKTDVNNRGGFSTDMIGMNYGWTEGSYAQRKKIFDAHVSYTKGLLYFFKTDKRVPGELSEFISNWGYPKDEYQQYGNFTPQLYVREARRMVGDYVMTEHNCRGEKKVTDGIGMAAYTMDSHNCQRIIENGMVKNEGNVEVGGFPPYPVSYRSLTPKEDECINLLVPVCLSSTHIAFGSIRMEPVFMVLAQSAAMAASMAIDGKVPVQRIDVGKLQQWLQDDPYLENSNK
ncbi:MAG: FAD-dependent oxidoreductase [Ginsengibacter sp.]